MEGEDGEGVGVGRGSGVRDWMGFGLELRGWIMIGVGGPNAYEVGLFAASSSSLGASVLVSVRGGKASEVNVLVWRRWDHGVSQVYLGFDYHGSVFALVACAISMTR